MRRLPLILVTACALGIAACSGGDATPTSEPGANSEATTTSGGGDSVTTAGGETGLTAVEIFARVSPSVAYIDTPLGTGSGFVINDRWLVSNAHVVWPFDTVRVVFPDGTAFDEAPVHAWDLIADLAVIQLPEGHGFAPVQFADPVELPVGSDLFLVGYPAEGEEFPQPTISAGILSRVRNWNVAELSYIQTDAAIAGGQSGGALISAQGEVVGLSGFKFADTFGLALAAPIVDERTSGLINGTDINSMSGRRLARGTSDNVFTFTLENFYDQRAFVVREAAGQLVDVELRGLNDGVIDVYDTRGLESTSADDSSSGSEFASFELDLEIPFIIVASQLNIGFGEFAISAFPGLAVQHDPDDGRVIQRGRTYIGAVDYPADQDNYKLDLDAGETVTVRVESLNFDPEVVIDSLENMGEPLAYNDDSAGGMFGTDAELTFTAPADGTYVVALGDAVSEEVGGYYLIVD